MPYNNRIKDCTGGKMNLTQNIVTIKVITDNEMPGIGNIIAIGASLNNSGGYKKEEFHARTTRGLFPKRDGYDLIISAIDMSIGVQTFQDSKNLIESFWDFYNKHLCQYNDLLCLSASTTLPVENLFSQCGADLKLGVEKSFYRPKSIIGLNQLLPMLTNGKYHDSNDYARDFCSEKGFYKVIPTGMPQSPLFICKTAFCVFNHLMSRISLVQYKMSPK